MVDNELDFCDTPYITSVMSIVAVSCKNLIELVTRVNCHVLQTMKYKLHIIMILMWLL